jgi:hypothetical protein
MYLNYGGDGVSGGIFPQYLVIFPYVSLSPLHLKKTFSFQTTFNVWTGSQKISDGNGTVMKMVGTFSANLSKEERKGSNVFEYLVI